MQCLCVDANLKSQLCVVTVIQTTNALVVLPIVWYLLNNMMVCADAGEER